MNKAFLVFLSCLLLIGISGCGGGGAAVSTPNGYLYSANSLRPGSMAGFSVTSGSLVQVAGTPFATAGNAPYTLAAWPPPLPSSVVTTEFLYAGIPATSKGGVINRVCALKALPCSAPSGSVTGGILMMPINSDHTLGTPQMFATPSDDYDPIAVTPPTSPGNVLYAIDLTASLLEPFSITSSNGALTAQASMQVGPDPFNVVVDPQGQFVFVANCDCTNPSNQGSVSVLSISTGTLTKFPIGGGAAHPIALAVSPDSLYLFVASLDDNVYVESIENIANGTNPDVGAAPLPSGSVPVSIAVSTDGNYVYTGNAGSHTLSFFLNCLSATQPTTPCSPPLAVPTNNSTTPASGTVGVILTDPTNPPPCTTTTQINCSSTSVSGFLYVTDYEHGTIQAYGITSTNACKGVTNCIPGMLIQSGSALTTGGANPFGLAITQ